MSVLNSSVFLEKEFLLLVIFSLLLPAVIYRTMWLMRAISRKTVLLFGLALIVLAGVDIFLLQTLANMAKLSSSVFDDKIFSSELTVALYLLPTLFAGTGINVVSHIIINHLTEAESQFDKNNP